MGSYLEGLRDNGKENGNYYKGVIMGYIGFRV